MVSNDVVYVGSAAIQGKGGIQNGEFCIMTKSHHEEMVRFCRSYTCSRNNRIRLIPSISSFRIHERLKEPK